MRTIEMSAKDMAPRAARYKELKPLAVQDDPDIPLEAKDLIYARPWGTNIRSGSRGCGLPRPHVPLDTRYSLSPIAYEVEQASQPIGLGICPPVARALSGQRSSGRREDGIFGTLLAWPLGVSPLLVDNLPQLLGVERQVDVGRAELAEGIDHRVRHGRRGSDRAGLSHALGA